MKLALGTVQFGMPYGISRVSGQVSPAEALKILNYAGKNGIDLLDTAISYGESEIVMGMADLSPFKIITKLPPVPLTSQAEIFHWVEKQVLGSLERMGSGSLYGLLLHRSTDLLGPAGSVLADALEELKFRGLVKKIGVSIYDPSELSALVQLVNIDIVQCPVSVIDRRLVTSGWLSRLFSAGVEIHGRSVFLQGLLLMPAHQRPKQFNRWRDLWVVWSETLRREGISPIEACLAYTAQIPEISRVVVGVHSLSQLTELIEVSQASRFDCDFSFMSSEDEDLINPTKWDCL